MGSIAEDLRTKARIWFSLFELQDVDLPFYFETRPGLGDVDNPGTMDLFSNEERFAVNQDR